MPTQSQRRDRFCLVALWLCYLVTMLLVSTFTSPLYPHWYGDDSALFSLLGKGILQGKILYTDLFDHKGPFIFFINALGHLLGGHTGILFLQVVFGCVSLTFLYFTAKMLAPAQITAKTCILYFAGVYAVFAYTFQQGNLTEEYAQPFISACLYCFVKYAVRCGEHPRHAPLYAFVYGICLAVLAFLRLNNAVTVCAGILAIFIYLLCKKEYGNLVWNLLAGCAGLALVAVPTCLYFYVHGALDEMIYASFLYNFNIVGKSGQQSFFSHFLQFSVLYLPMAICFILFTGHLIRNRKITFPDCLLGCILITNFLNLYLANRYPHYFTNFIPVYLIFLFRYFKPDRKKLAVWLVAVCAAAHLLFAGYYAAASFHNCHISGRAALRRDIVHEAFSAIPESERDQVIGYQIPVSYYLFGDTVPCYKYYTWQESWARIDNRILADFMEWAREEKPLWILTPPGEDNPYLLEILQQQYEIQFENQLLICYRLTQSP